MKNILFLLFAFSSYFALSQVNINQDIRSVKTDLNGDFIIVGNHNNGTPNSSSGYILKISTNGNEIIHENYSVSNGFSVFFNVFNISNYHIVLGSYSQDSINYLHYLKYDNNFNILNRKFIKIENLREIGYMNSIIDSENNIVVSGYTSRPDPTFQSNYDPFFIKLNQNGDSITSFFYNTISPFDFSYHLVESCDSTKYLAFMDAYDYTNCRGLLKLTKNFTFIDCFPLPIYKIYSPIVVDSQIYITGKPLNENNYKLYVVKIDENGNELNSNSFYKSLTIKEEPALHQGLSKYNNNMYLGGTSNCDYSNPNFTSNDSWFHLIKLDFNLLPVWEKWYGGDAYYFLNSVFATSDGGCLMLGTKYLYGLSTQTTVAHFIKVDSNGNVQWTQDIETHDISFNLYPNPTSSFFIIENKDFSIEKIELFDLSGKIISVIDNCENANIQINLEPFSNGIYFAKITTSKGITTQKVVKQ
jgi:hypothetical protein